MRVLVQGGFSATRAAVLAGCAMAASACASSSGPASDAGPLPAQTADGPVEAAPEAGPAVDAGCQPMNLTGYHPPRAVPFPARSGVCNGYNGEGGLVEAYADACLGHAATYETCAAFAVPDAGAAADCLRCLLSTESADASTYGAVVVVTVPLVNYASCVTALDPTDAGAACAQAVTASAACSEYACKAACPVVDESSEYAYIACANATTSGACAGYALQAEACLAAEQGDGGTPVANVCFAGMTAADHYFGVAHYLCGGD